MKELPLKLVIIDVGPGLTFDEAYDRLVGQEAKTA